MILFFLFPKQIGLSQIWGQDSRHPCHSLNTHCLVPSGSEGVTAFMLLCSVQSLPYASAPAPGFLLLQQATSLGERAD